MRALNLQELPRASSRPKGRVSDCRPAALRRTDAKMSLGGTPFIPLSTLICHHFNPHWPKDQHFSVPGASRLVSLIFNLRPLDFGVFFLLLPAQRSFVSFQGQGVLAHNASCDHSPGFLGVVVQLPLASRAKRDRRLMNLTLIVGQHFILV